jgi:hypothetical protein
MKNKGPKVLKTVKNTDTKCHTNHEIATQNRFERSTVKMPRLCEANIITPQVAATARTAAHAVASLEISNILRSMPHRRPQPACNCLDYYNLSNELETHLPFCSCGTGIRPHSNKMAA